MPPPRRPTPRRVRARRAGSSALNWRQCHSTDRLSNLPVAEPEKLPLYPAPAGLTDSLRARRLRDGLLDHWLYLRAWRHCEGANQAACRAKLIGVKARLTRDPSTIADFSRDPGDYDNARELMIGILEN